MFDSDGCPASLGVSVSLSPYAAADSLCLDVCLDVTSSAQALLISEYVVAGVIPDSRTLGTYTPRRIAAK